jgi:hypothetical protein
MAVRHRRHKRPASESQYLVGIGLYVIHLRVKVGEHVGLVSRRVDMTCHPAGRSNIV